jgi:hypothetical protein
VDAPPSSFIIGSTGETPTQPSVLEQAMKDKQQTTPTLPDSKKSASSSSSSQPTAAQISTRARLARELIEELAREIQITATKEFPDTTASGKVQKEMEENSKKLDELLVLNDELTGLIVRVPVLTPSSASAPGAGAGGEVGLGPNLRKKGGDREGSPTGSAESDASNSTSGSEGSWESADSHGGSGAGAGAGDVVTGGVAASASATSTSQTTKAPKGKPNLKLEGLGPIPGSGTLSKKKSSPQANGSVQSDSEDELTPTTLSHHQRTPPTRAEKGKDRAPPSPIQHEPVLSPTSVLARQHLEPPEDDSDEEGDEGYFPALEDVDGEGAMVGDIGMELSPTGERSRSWVEEEGEVFRKGNVLLGPEEMEGEYDGEELRQEVRLSSRSFLIY